MNGINSPLSRRTFLLSTAATVASSVLQRSFPFEAAATDDPLHVSIVGFGRHAQRLVDSVTNSALCVDAVFDPDPVALGSASTLLQERQRFLPKLVRTSHPALIAQSSSPVLLCSPPHTWAALIPHLTEQRRPVLAHHTQLFANPHWPEILDLLARQSANLFIVGLDPAFPLQSLSSFHTFARSRGAVNSSYSFWHPSWPHSQLLAFHYDCLNAALPPDVSPDNHSLQFLPMAVQPGPPSLASARSGSASCSISAAGPGIAFGAHLEIAEADSMVDSSAEYFIQFANFCRVPQGKRNSILLRQSELLKLVDASTETIDLYV
jgi:hypothetical protein